MEMDLNRDIQRDWIVLRNTIEDFSSHKTKNCFCAILMFQRNSSSYFPYKCKGLLLKNGRKRELLSVCSFIYAGKCPHQAL